MSGSGDVTAVLKAISAGDRGAMDALIPLVEKELRSKAEYLMERERPDHTLQATALVNEAYLKLVDQTRTRWRDRVHFFAIAARVMRRILADHARKNGRLKRGQRWTKVSLEDVEDRVIDSDNAGSGRGDTVDVAALDAVLEKLEAIDEDLARVVEFRYFGGLSERQVAVAMGVNVRTVQRHWKSARTWLFCELSRAAP